MDLRYNHSGLMEYLRTFAGKYAKIVRKSVYIRIWLCTSINLQKLSISIICNYTTLTVALPRKSRSLQTIIRSYKLRELYQMEGQGKTYRAFQRRKEEFVEVLIPVGKRMQKRYLDKTNSQFFKILQGLLK